MFKLPFIISVWCVVPGLPCGSHSTLEVGVRLKVSSRLCRGQYPNNEQCQWKFQVGPRCLPRIHCKRLDILGNWRRGCPGDRLSVETENVRFNWCGKKKNVEFGETKSIRRVVNHF